VKNIKNSKSNSIGGALYIRRKVQKNVTFVQQNGFDPAFVQNGFGPAFFGVFFCMLRRRLAKGRAKPNFTCLLIG
jgi:hypothetical protein